jgi:hypothetical protein
VPKKRHSSEQIIIYLREFDADLDRLRGYVRAHCRRAGGRPCEDSPDRSGMGRTVEMEGGHTATDEKTASGDARITDATGKQTHSIRQAGWGVLQGLVKRHPGGGLFHELVEGRAKLSRTQREALQRLFRMISCRWSLPEGIELTDAEFGTLAEANAYLDYPRD